jgi:hypothetical protein
MVDIDKSEVALVKIVGGRLTEARLLCKLPRHVAAERLGVTVIDLERIETGVDIERIPLKVIRQASLIYDVSCDFLFGFSEDWEIDPKTRQDREFAAYLHQSQTRLFSTWAVRQMRLERQMTTLAPAVDALRLAVSEIYEALDRFRALNEKFDLMLGGALLLNRIQKGNQAALSARNAMVKANLLPLQKYPPES